MVKGVTKRLVCDQDTSPSLAPETVAVVQQEYDGVTEKISSFVSELTGILVWSAIRRDRPILTKLFNLLTDT